MLRYYAQRYLAKGVFFFWFVILAIPFWGIVLLLDAYEELRLILAPLGFLACIFWLVGSWWFSLTTNHYLFAERKVFLDAVKSTLSDFRFKMTFVPLVGALFEPDEDKTKPDDDAT